MTLTFPRDFLWGAATAAFQIEGAAVAEGKGPSIWDEFCAIPGRTRAGDTGAVACDHYHRVAEDVALMRALGLRCYRLSVSWPRVLPAGRGTVNAAGLDFYDRLVDQLVAANVEPLVTLFHWDLPAALQAELGGWGHADLPHIFADYAALVFRRLGDRVRWWLTLNEPWCVVDGGYVHGGHAPGLQDRPLGYRVGHHLLRGHAYAVAQCRALLPEARISLAINTTYNFPATDAPADVAAAERATLNFGGWFADPPYFGDYPAVLRERLGALLPAFTPEDARLLKGSTDYFALNYYSSDIVRDAPGKLPMQYEVVPQPERPVTTMGWPIVPEGLGRLARWLSARYTGLPIFITENGAAFDDQPDDSGYVDDQNRIAYLREHLTALAEAIADGVNICGYCVWSLLDNLEWAHGFAKRFGVIRCDFKTLRRTMKASGRWYASVIASGQLDGH